MTFGMGILLRGAPWFMLRLIQMTFVKSAQNLTGEILGQVQSLEHCFLQCFSTIISLFCP